MNDFEDLLREMEKGADCSLRITDIEEIRREIARPKLEGLVQGDLIVQIADSKGQRFTKNEDKPVVFVRYLSEAEKVALMSRGDSGGQLQEADIVICYFIQGSPVYHAADSSRYKRI